MDKGSFTVHAREQGFAARGERFIRIIGRGSPQKEMISPGQVISIREPEYTPDRFLRILSFFIALTTFLSMGAYDFLRNLRER
jgi:hypothetical protein